jgi:outer membrane protein OmpA-like peptidoglycan-associated protein
MSLLQHPPAHAWRWAAVLAVCLCACAVPTVPAPSVPPPVSAAPAPPTAASNTYIWSPQLEAAARRLRASLKGADVAQTTDQRLWISLPGDETFVPGRSAIKPTAGLWLDEVAKVLRDLPRADLQIVGSPDKAERGSDALALDRAASARDWMVMRGVAARRMAVSGQTPRPRVAPENRLEILIGERSAAPATGSSSAPR